MHYGDPKHLEENCLEVIIYKGEFGDSYHIDLNSIRQCQYVSPWALADFFEHPEDYIDEAAPHLDFEQWAFLTFEEDENGELQLVNVEPQDIYDREFLDDPFNRLH